MERLASFVCYLLDFVGFVGLGCIFVGFSLVCVVFFGFLGGPAPANGSPASGLKKLVLPKVKVGALARAKMYADSNDTKGCIDTLLIALSTSAQCASGGIEFICVQQNIGFTSKTE